MNDKVSLSKKSSVKRKKQRKNADSHSITERYEILDGAVTVIRTTKSGQFWSMSCWLRQEEKCYRKSLRTKNLEEAKEFARDQYFKLMGDIRSGNRIFSKRANEIVTDFIKFKKEQADAGLITQERVKTIATSLKWFLRFVGENTHLEKISKYKFQEYYAWRRKLAPEVKKVTLVNERAMISSLYKYGIQRGYFRHDQAPIFPMLKKSQVERRDAFDDKEYRKLYSCFPDWIKKSANEKEMVERKFIRDFITLSVNTGLRFGEMRKLKWKMINIRPTNKKEKSGEPIAFFQMVCGSYCGFALWQRLAHF